MKAMSKKWLYGLIGVVILALAAGLVVIKNKELATTNKPVQRNVPVQVATAKSGVVPVTLHYLGKAESVLTADITSRIAASILAVRYREGDTVRAGEVLVDLDDMTLANKVRASDADTRAAQSLVASAESNYQAQKASFDRDEYLYKNKALSQEAYERSKAITDAAYSQIVVAQERVKFLSESRQASATELGYAHIAAPFAGVITKRSAEPGELAVPGKPLLTLQGMNDGYKITTQVPQEQAVTLKPGIDVIVSDGTNKATATVYKVYPALASNSLVTVEIRMTEMPFKLPAGSNLGVDFVMNRAEGLVVPVQALAINKKGAFVVIVGENNVVHQAPVQVVGRNDKEAAITGIDPNATVVVGQENLLMQLMDGKTVTVIPAGGDGK
ncbi:MAG: efflux RND transporter periplasmic adaptor subunit [Negativicutes bacterium]|nr:efflux RND transporter periplasmic adaptor subunit [Negativicutes bacterium]